MFEFQEHHFVACIIFFIAFIGMSCNWFVVIFISRVSTLQNAFGRLTTSQAISEAIHLTIFSFFVAPMIFLDSPAMKDLSHRFGHLLLICYDICIYCHLLISLNRLTAIVMPLSYDQIFSTRNTRIMIFCAWTLAIVPSIYFYIFADCKFHYAGDFWHFEFINTPICNAIAWYTDFLKYVTIVIIIVMIDLFTVVKVHFLNTSIFKHNVLSQSRRIRRANELNFLKQACLQAFVFVCELITYFFLYNYFDHRYIKFGLTTVAWICVHSTDGFITVIFNREFHYIKCKSKNIVSNVQHSDIKTVSSHGILP